MLTEWINATSSFTQALGTMAEEYSEVTIPERIRSEIVKARDIAFKPIINELGKYLPTNSETNQAFKHRLTTVFAKQSPAEISEKAARLQNISAKLTHLVEVCNAQSCSSILESNKQAEVAIELQKFYQAISVPLKVIFSPSFQVTQKFDLLLKMIDESLDALENSLKADIAQPQKEEHFYEEGTFGRLREDAIIYLKELLPSFQEKIVSRNPALFVIDLSDFIHAPGNELSDTDKNILTLFLSQAREFADKTIESSKTSIIQPSENLNTMKKDIALALSKFAAYAFLDDSSLEEEILKLDKKQIPDWTLEKLFIFQQNFVEKIKDILELREELQSASMSREKKEDHLASLGIYSGTVKTHLLNQQISNADKREAIFTYMKTLLQTWIHTALTDQQKSQLEEVNSNIDSFCSQDLKNTLQKALDQISKAA